MKVSSVPIMKALLYGINYAPEAIGIPRYTTEMAEFLCSKGWEIEVITAYPSYPNWKEVSGYNYKRYSNELMNGVRVHRVPTFIPRKLTASKRFVFECLFFLASLPLVLKLSKRHDVCIVTSPPFILGIALRFLPKKIIKVLIVKDLQVDIARTNRLVKSRLVLSILEWLEKIGIRCADLVSGVSSNMVGLLEKRLTKVKS